MDTGTRIDETSPAARDTPTTDEPAGGNESRLWTYVAWLIIAVAAILRLYDITLKPLHHDEGVNGFFLLDLFRHGVYRYNPANYHGPTLYYFSLVVCSINNLIFGGEGTTTRALRILPVLSGTATVALVIAFRRWLGTLATVSAAALLALSPGAVYLSRDFIHEPLLVFFTLALVYYGLQFWRARQRQDLVMCAVTAALMFSTKETTPISWAAIALAAGLAVALVNSQCRPAIQDFGGLKNLANSLSLAALLFLACCIVFFSSFLGNFPQGLRDAVSTYTYWSRTGMSQQTAPWFTHVRWLLRIESPIFLLGIAGALLALIRRNNRFALFSGLWGLGLLAIYSALPYKTPWLLLNIIVPMAFSAGYAIEESWRAGHANPVTRAVVAVIGIAALSVSLYQSVLLNFFHYDDDRWVYPYAQTQRGFMRLVDQIDGSAQGIAAEKTSIAILSPDYWPLPWYTRNYLNAGFYGKITATNADLVIVSTLQQAQAEPMLGGYTKRGSYPLRPGVQLTLYVANHASH